MSGRSSQHARPRRPPRPAPAGGAPLPPAPFVARPRVRALLDAAVLRGGAIVVAPGGFGKTVALADFARRAPFPVAWIGLRPVHADPVAFVDALLAAVAAVRPRAGPDRMAAALARGASSGRVDAVVAALAAALAPDEDGPVGVVLDDFHAVDGSHDVQEIVGGLLQELTPSCFFALGSRSVPRLPHARLVASGRLVGVSAEALRFTPGEVAAYLGVPPHDDRARLMHAVTKGWPAALALGAAEAGLAAVDEYLEQEVLRQEAPETQDFLLAAAVPEDLTREVCARVLAAPDGPERLAALHRSGTFVERTADGGWRLHDRFRDVLRVRLRAADPARWRALHRAWAAHLVDERRVPDAVQALVGAELPDDAADVLAAHAEALAADGRWSAVRAWTGALPRRCLGERPRLLVLHARALGMTVPLDEMLAVIDDAVAACERGGDALGAAEGLAYRANRLVVAGRSGEAAADCARARALLGDRDHRVLAAVLRYEGAAALGEGGLAAARPLFDAALACAHRHRDRNEAALTEYWIGYGHAAEGDHGPAAAAFARAIPAFEDAANVTYALMTRANLSECYIEQGAEELARATAAAAVDLAERAGLERDAAIAGTYLAVLDQETGDHAAALVRWRHALAVAERLGDAMLLGNALDGAAQVLRASGGDLGEAEACARRALAELDRSPVVAPMAAAWCATLAAVLLARGRYRAAAEEAAAALAVPTAGPSGSARVRANLAAAVAHFRLDPTRGAWVGHLRRAADALDGTARRGFLRQEARVLGADLAAMARSAPEAALLVEALRAPPLPAPATPAAGPRGLPRVRLRTLGRAAVWVDERPPRAPSDGSHRRATWELLCLLAEARAGLAADALVGRLWPAAEPGRGQALLWTHVHQLRGALAGGDRGARREVLQLHEGAYRLHPDLAVEHDAAAFEAVARRALAAADAAALAHAAALYAGPYLEGWDTPWIAARRQELERLHLRVLAALAARCLADGALDAAALHAERWYRADPYAEGACAAYLRALVAAGARDRARQVYRTFARRLARVLGTVPSPELPRIVGLPAGA